jgi:hypothetical protein
VAALAHLHVEHLELLGHVATGDDQVDAALAEVVEHDHVFGEAERVVERRDERRDDEADVRGARRHRRQHRDRAREIAVGGPVVLGDGDAHAAQAVSPLRHLEGRRVAVGRGRAGDLGVAEVEAQAEQHALTHPARAGHAPGARP